MTLFDIEPQCARCGGPVSEPRVVFDEKLGSTRPCPSPFHRGAGAAAPVRHTDPPESREAAATVKIRRDRALILRGFHEAVSRGDDDGATFHDAAVEAQRLEGSTGDHFRGESLRRRGSDLKVLGLIRQTGRRDGKAIFRLTIDGLRQLGL